MNITIPFKSCWKDKMLSGRKTCTTRTKRYGRVGDIFEAFGEKFVIEKVGRHRLGIVMFGASYEDGFESSYEMKDFWKKLHPYRRYDEDMKVWAHWFKKIE